MLDYNDLGDEQFIEQFPGLYQQMSEFIGKMIQGRDFETLLKAKQIMENATISGGGFYDVDGSFIGGIKLSSSEDFDVSDINDELLQELFSGFGVDGNGEIRGNEGAKGSA